MGREIVADRGGRWEDRRSVHPSVYLCFDRLSYSRSKLRDSVGDGGCGQHLHVCVSACPSRSEGF